MKLLEWLRQSRRIGVGQAAGLIPAVAAAIAIAPAAVRAETDEWHDGCLCVRTVRETRCSATVAAQPDYDPWPPGLALCAYPAASTEVGTFAVEDVLYRDDLDRTRQSDAGRPDHSLAPGEAESEPLAEEGAARRARTERTIAACDRYLTRYPDGRQRAAVLALRDELTAWNQAVTEDTVAAYGAFAQRFPRSLLPARERTRSVYWHQRTARAPRDHRAWLQRAEACLAEGCPLNDLRASYERALQLRSDSVRPLLALAAIEVNAGETRQAEAQVHVERLLRLDARLPEAHYYAGLLAKRRSCQQALPHFDQALRLRATYSEALFQRAECRQETQGCAAAVGDLQRLLMLARDNDESKLQWRARQLLADCTGP